MITGRALYVEQEDDSLPNVQRRLVKQTSRIQKVADLEAMPMQWFRSSLRNEWSSSKWKLR